jgi:hypothetical protein
VVGLRLYVYPLLQYIESKSILFHLTLLYSPDISRLVLCSSRSIVEMALTNDSRGTYGLGIPYLRPPSLANVMRASTAIFTRFCNGRFFRVPTATIHERFFVQLLNRGEELPRTIQALSTMHTSTQHNNSIYKITAIASSS